MGGKALGRPTAITGLLKSRLAVVPPGNNFLEVAYHGEKPLIGDLRYLCSRGRSRMSDNGAGQAKGFDTITHGTTGYTKLLSNLGLAQARSMEGPDLVCIDRSAVHSVSPEHYCGHHVYLSTHEYTMGVHRYECYLP